MPLDRVVKPKDFFPLSPTRQSIAIDISGFVQSLMTYCFGIAGSVARAYNFAVVISHIRSLKSGIGECPELCHRSLATAFVLSAGEGAGFTAWVNSTLEAAAVVLDMAVPTCGLDVPFGVAHAAFPVSLKARTIISEDLETSLVLARTCDMKSNGLAALLPRT